jgi:hypothetical protein
MTIRNVVLATALVVAFPGSPVAAAPGLKAPRGSKLLTWSPAGTIAVTIGNQMWAGGETVLNYSAGGFITNGTLTVDGKPLVEKGVLKVGPAAK